MLCALMGVPVVTLTFSNARPTDDAHYDDGMEWDEVFHHNRFDSLLYERVRAEGLCGRDLRAVTAGDYG